MRFNMASVSVVIVTSFLGCDKSVDATRADLAGGSAANAVAGKPAAAASAPPAAIAISDLAGQWMGTDMRLMIEKSGKIKGTVGYHWSDGRRVVWNGVAEGVEQDGRKLSMKLGESEWTAEASADG